MCLTEVECIVVQEYNALNVNHVDIKPWNGWIDKIILFKTAEARQWWHEGRYIYLEVKRVAINLKKKWWHDGEYDNDHPF